MAGCAAGTAGRSDPKPMFPLHSDPVEVSSGHDGAANSRQCSTTPAADPCGGRKLGSLGLGGI